MLNEYLSLGGVEIANAARAYAYGRCLSCCGSVLKVDGCPGLHDATSPFDNAVWQDGAVISPASSLEPPYSCGNISRAPWYDASVPESAELAGFYPLSVKGATDSTMTSVATESLGDGGVIGPQRHAVRSVRVRLMIVACGSAAAEYGLAWLKAALGRRACGRHGDSCGTSDLAFFVDCPPVLDASEQDYASLIAPYKRYLHDVSCTSGPIVSEEYRTSSGAHVTVVEFILSAENPYIYGETMSVGLGSTISTSYDDAAFNLMRYPSAEVGNGVAQTVSTNYVLDGSVEYGGSGWEGRGSGSLPVLGALPSNLIAAVGANSWRVYSTAGSTGAGSLSAVCGVSLSAIPASTTVSLSMWLRMAASTGGVSAFTRASLAVEWWTAAGGSLVSTTPVWETTDPAVLAALPLGVVQRARGLTIPNTATYARLVAKLEANASSGITYAVHGDAAALTVP